ncbi:hypothetical protein F4678DRAFT_485979 [Xylaria arbuscula]|nr:hypothetical protein F4678DRAFT_485979 [Xylaria arbuscula]
MADLSQGPVSAPSISNVGLLGVLWSGTSFSIIVVTIRFIVRYKLFGRLKADDFFVLAAVTFCLGSTITWTLCSKDLYLALPGERESFTINPAEYIEKVATGLNANLASYILSYSALWSIKFSFMAFFKPLGEQLRSQRILWWTSLVFIFAGYVICIGLLDYRCLTSNGFTVLANCTSKKVADYSYAGIRVTTSLDIFSDVLTAIIRITVGARGEDPDISWFLVWNSIEMTLGKRDGLLVDTRLPLTKEKAQKDLMSYPFTAVFVACIASFRSLYCHTKHSRLVERPNPHPLKTPPARNFLASTFGTDTILCSEQSQWVQRLSEDSRKEIWASRDFDTGIETVELQKPSQTLHV